MRSLSEKLERAISNLTRVATQLLSLGQEPPRVTWIDGRELSWKEIIEEMKKGTAAGLYLVELWARPEEEIQDEIRKAQAATK